MRASAFDSGHTGSRSRILAIPHRLWPLVLPELRRLSPAERPAALRAARATTPDALELIGMVAALAAVTGMTRYVAAQAGFPAGFVGTALNFGVALPSLALLLAPLHVRRLRRGLQQPTELRKCQ